MAVDEEVNHLSDHSTPQESIDTEEHTDEGCGNSYESTDKLQPKMQVASPLSLKKVDIVRVDREEDATNTEDLKIRSCCHPLVTIEEMVQGMSQNNQRRHYWAGELKEQAHHATIART